MKFILTTDNAGAIPAHFRELEIVAQGVLDWPIAKITNTQSGLRPPALIQAAEKLVSQANAADDLLAALQNIIDINGCTGGYKALVEEFKHIARTAIAKAEQPA